MGPGDRFADRYSVVEHIGSGGMGDVYRVLDEELGEEVALKVLSHGEWLERFRAEVRLARHVTHRNVARIFDIGSAKVGVVDEHYLTMELVDGVSLRKRMREGPSFSLKDAVVFARDLADGLAAAHAAGVVHGDLKPGNVMIDARTAPGRVVLIDFGLAKSVDASREPGDVVLGTPSYMAPEQLRRDGSYAAGVAAPADVYALGLVVFELFARERPFHGATGVDVVRARLSLDAPDLRSYRAVPAELADVVARCLMRDPSRRPASSSVAAALARIAESSLPADVDSGTDRDDPFASEPTAIVAVPGVQVVAVAVLPLRLAHDRGPRAAALADGLTDALRELLASTSGLRVLATDAGKKLPAAIDARAAGAELGVDAVVTGVVDVGEHEVAIAVRLVDVDTGKVLLDHRVSGRVGDLLRVQDRAARAIAEKLRKELTTGAYEDVVPTAAVEAWLATRERMRPGQGTDPVTAYEEMERCIAAAPKFLLAYAGRAVAAARLALVPRDPKHRAWAPLARAALADALAAAPDVPDTHFAAALVAELDGHYGDVVAALERTLRLAPAFSEAHELLGRLEMESGRVQDGSRRLFLAADLDPRCLPALALVARSAMFRDHESVAVRLAHRIEQGPIVPLELWLLYARVGIWRQRAAEQEQYVRGKLASLDVSIARELIGGALDAAAGDLAPLLEFGARIEKEGPPTRYLALVHQLCVEALACRDRAAALDQLEGADWHGLFDLEWLDRCPPLRALADDARFVRVRERVARRVLRPA